MESAYDHDPAALGQRLAGMLGLVFAAVFSLRPAIALHHTIGTVDQEADAFHAGQ